MRKGDASPATRIHDRRLAIEGSHEVKIRYDKDGKFKSASIEMKGFPFDQPGVRIIAISELHTPINPAFEAPIPELKPRPYWADGQTPANALEVVTWRNSTDLDDVRKALEETRCIKEVYQPEEETQ